MHRRGRGLIWDTLYVVQMVAEVNIQIRFNHFNDQIQGEGP